MSEEAPHYGEMNEQRAREILGLGPTGGLMNCLDVYHVDGDSVGIDAVVSVEALEAIVWWMRNKALK